MASFAEQLRGALDATGVSQSELARRLEVGPNQIHDYTSGRSIPRPSRQKKIAEILNTSFDDDPQTKVDMTDTAEFTTDEAPAPRHTAAKKKAAPAKKSVSKATGLPLVEQLRFPYQLAAQATAGRLPNTSAVLERQALPCAMAWDQFLMRFPALREKIEQGMIATDVVALIMAHLPILQVIRQETEMIAARRASYDGGLGSAA